MLLAVGVAFGYRMILGSSLMAGAVAGLSGVLVALIGQGRHAVLLRPHPFIAPEVSPATICNARRARVLDVLGGSIRVEAVEHAGVLSDLDKVAVGVA